MKSHPVLPLLLFQPHQTRTPFIAHHHHHPLIKANLHLLLFTGVNFDLASGNIKLPHITDRQKALVADLHFLPSLLFNMILIKVVILVEEVYHLPNTISKTDDTTLFLCHDTFPAILLCFYIESDDVMMGVTSKN